MKRRLGNNRDGEVNETEKINRGKVLLGSN